MKSYAIAEISEYKTRNQVQIFSTIKCIEVSEVTLTIHVVHPLHPGFDLSTVGFLSQSALAELKTSQYPKKDPNLVPKCQQILRNENAP